MRTLLLITTLLISNAVTALTYGDYEVVSAKGPLEKSCTGGKLITRRFEGNTMIELSPSIIFTNIGAGEKTQTEATCVINGHTYWINDNSRLIQETKYEDKCPGGAAEVIQTLDVKGNQLEYTHIEKGKLKRQKTFCIFKLEDKS